MTTMTQLFDNSMYFGGNAPFVEELYEKYLDNRPPFPTNGATISTAWPRCPAMSPATYPRPQSSRPSPNWPRTAVSARGPGLPPATARSRLLSCS